MTGPFRLGSRLGSRLYPVTLAIGVLVSLGLPATYYALERMALRQASIIYAQNLADKLEELILVSPALWKYGTYKYRGLLDDFVASKDHPISAIRVLDDERRPVIAREEGTPRPLRWWRRLAPVGSAPIVFNNHTVGTVEVTVAHGTLLVVTVGLLLFSTTVGAVLAVAVYFVPVRVVRGMEREIERSNTELARRAGLQQSLVEASRLLASTLDLEEVLGRLTEIARTLLGVDIVRIWLAEPERSELVLRAQSGATHLAVEHRRRFAMGEGLTGVIMSTGKALALTDVMAHPVLKNREWFEAEGIESFLGVPLFVNRTPVGILASMSRTGRVWSEEEIRSAKWLAIAAAIAIRNAQLYREASSRLERMRRLTRLSQTITSSLDVQQVLAAVTEAAVDLLGGDLVRLWTIDDAGARLAASHAREGFQVPGPAPAVTPPTISWVIEHRSNRYSPNLDEEPLEVGIDRARSSGCTSQIAAPLVVGDRALGALAVLTRASRRWTLEEEELLELFAATAAASLENARLFAATRAQATALREKNAELDAFVYSVSHDLKAPLVTIQGMAGMLFEDCAPALGDTGRHYVERIRANIHQMERLIGDLLALSRVGREGRAPEAVDLTELVAEVLAELAEPIRERGVKVARGDLGTVWGVRTQIEQVLLNLSSNAVKYMGDTGSPTIEIGTADAGDFVECWVRDNGIGVAPTYHEKIFELFQRLKEVEAEGTGVGLAIVKKIVEGVSGRVWIESEAGQGSTFHFTWPKAPRSTNGTA